MTARNDYSLLHNSRFYILAFSLLLSIALFAWFRIAITSDQLFLIRAQQVYGFVCLAFWYAAMIISPIGYIVGKQRMKHIEFARRAIGVSAFYFALLHTLIALFWQLGGIAQLQYLPELFKWSLFGGGVALVVLGLMAATSFDKVIAFMTFRKWKWLHRLVYMAGVLVILHIWMIGTHLAYGGVQIAGFWALALLIGLEVYRTTLLLNNKYQKLSRSELLITAMSVWVCALVVLLAMPNFIDNYHSRHTDHGSHQEHL